LAVGIQLRFPKNALLGNIPQKFRKSTSINTALRCRRRVFDIEERRRTAVHKVKGSIPFSGWWIVIPKRLCRKLPILPKH